MSAHPQTSDLLDQVQLRVQRTSDSLLVSASILVAGESLHLGKVEYEIEQDRLHASSPLSTAFSRTLQRRLGVSAQAITRLCSGATSYALSRLDCERILLAS